MKNITKTLLCFAAISLVSACDNQPANTTQEITQSNIIRIHPPGTVLTHVVGANGSLIAYVLRPLASGPPAASNSPDPDDQVLVYDVASGTSRHVGSIPFSGSFSPYNVIDTITMKMSEKGERLLITSLSVGTQSSAGFFRSCSARTIDLASESEVVLFSRNVNVPEFCSVQTDQAGQYAAFIDDEASGRVIRVWDLAQQKLLYTAPASGAAQLFSTEFQPSANSAPNVTAFYASHDVKTNPQGFGTDHFRSLELSSNQNVSPVELFSVPSQYNDYSPTASFLARRSPDGRFWIVAVPNTEAVVGNINRLLISSDGKRQLALSYFGPWNGSSTQLSGICPSYDFTETNYVFSKDSSSLTCLGRTDFEQVALNAGNTGNPDSPLSIGTLYKPTDANYQIISAEAVGEQGFVLNYGVCTDQTCAKHTGQSIWLDPRRGEAVPIFVGCDGYYFPQSFIKTVESDAGIWAYSACGLNIYSMKLSLEKGSQPASTQIIPSFKTPAVDKSKQWIDFSNTSNWATVYTSGYFYNQNSTVTPVWFWAFSLAADSPEYVRIDWSEDITGDAIYGVHTEWLDGGQGVLIDNNGTLYIAKR
jgi:hypothetical protein